MNHGALINNLLAAGYSVTIHLFADGKVGCHATAIRSGESRVFSRVGGDLLSALTLVAVATGVKVE